jgi:radical SAM-linked protein
LLGKSIQLHVSFSSFVPKPHTPLQWAGREALESTKQKIHFLKKELKRFRNLRFDFHPPERSIVETIIARGDSRVGDLLFRAYQAGEIFSAWDSHFNFHSWLPLIEHLDLGLFLEPIPLTQPLPWDFIEVNYNSGYLKEEYKRAMTGAKTPSCWDQECRDCRGCGLPWRSPKEPQTDPEDELPPSKKDPIPDHFHRVRIFYKKDGDYRCFSHLSMIKYIERIIRKTGIKFKCTEGFHPRLKASHLPPLPVHATGCEEIVEMHLDANLNAEEIFSSLKSHAEGVEFFKVEICNDRPPLSKDIHYIVYSMKVTEAISSETKIAHLLAPTDSGIAQKNRLIIKIDFRNNGMARFGKIYNILDPDRHHTHNLRRDRVIFKHDIPD